ncbi:hypothetical protein IMSHALPRED_009657 [Imshaugia aleurites]|uniref:Gag-like protein n=1 Tax=Imshaugia aleurites TaxID=172621 RepID=A0A8H3G0D7_9LECA|nr:hypothetical protein IMSHALPRED_009657 [Imshaugia aleurites]
MATYSWPNPGRHRPEDKIEHAACLKADFDSVSNAANASLSNTTLLPAGLESRISAGIKKGIAEACSFGICPNWTDIDKSIFRKVMLKSIATEAALEARDRIPLDPFHGLRESFSALYTKLATQMPSATTNHHFVHVNAATQAQSVVDLVNADRKAKKDTNLTGTSNEMTTTRHGEKAKEANEESDSDTSDDEVSEMDKTEDVAVGQEVIERENSESTDDSRDDGSSSEQDDNEGSEMDEAEDVAIDQEVVGSGESDSADESSDDGLSSGEEGEDVSETDSDVASMEENNQQTVREENTPIIIRDGMGFSTTVSLKIVRQASVNVLERMTASQLSDYLSSSLKEFLCGQHLSFKKVHISDMRLLDNGDVKVHIQAKTREAIQKINGPKGWDPEKYLPGSSVPICKVGMHKVEINSLKFRTRKEKAAIIKKLADENNAIGHDKLPIPIIGDIRWSRYTLPKVEAVLIIDFLDPEQATEALVRGLHWQGKLHGCERGDCNRRLLRCTRCQGYGHYTQKCSAPHRCGTCAGQHPTKDCNSKEVKCASCGGRHSAGHKACPAKVKARRSLGFLKENASQAAKSAANTQVSPSPSVQHSTSAATTQIETPTPSPGTLSARSAKDDMKAENEQSLPGANPTQDTYPDTDTLLKRIEECSQEINVLKKTVVARDFALQTQSSSQTKRRAGEAFGGAEAESSNMAAKRIKQEPPTRENSMGLYRQPSPFLLQRSK